MAAYDTLLNDRPDCTVRVWDANTGRPVGDPLTGHGDQVEAVAIGRVGDRDVIVSASYDNTVRIWDFAEGGSLVVDLLGRAKAVALTKDGRSLCVSAGHTICLFNAQSTHAETLPSVRLHRGSMDRRGHSYQDDGRNRRLQ